VRFRKTPPKDDARWFFCEPVTAASLAPWHIRERGPKGRMLGGGADTLALCGRKVSWDLKVDVTPESMRMLSATSVCAKCRAMWETGRVSR